MAASEAEHDVFYASAERVECRCGHIALSRFGHEAHLDESGLTVVDDPDDPTWRADFNPANWTGTIMSGLISRRAECGECGAEWVDGHECPA